MTPISQINILIVLAILSTNVDSAEGTCEAKHAEDSKQCSALRKNDHVVIKNRPCKIVEISTKTGKNGQSEMHFLGLDIFTQKKLNDICQHNDSRDVPTIKSKDYQLLSLDDGFLSLYDPDTVDQREDLNIPDGEIAEEIRAAIENDKAILCIVLSACGEEAVIGTKQDVDNLY